MRSAVIHYRLGIPTTPDYCVCFAFILVDVNASGPMATVTAPYRRWR